MSVAEKLRFAGYELNPTSGELHGPSGTVRLQPQPARVLTLLLMARGELVTREKLQREVWPDTHVEVDQGLNYCIRHLRAALGDSSHSPRFIQTLPRRGYRFLQPIEDPPSAALGEITGRGLVAPRPRRWAIALAGLAAVAILIWLVGARREPAAEPAVRLALFPLALPGRSSLPAEIAMADSLLVSLTRLGGDRLEVVGPVSTAPLVATGQPFREIARQLDAELLLDGGLRPDGDLFLELLRTADGAHLWAQRQPLAELSGASDQLADEILAVAMGDGDDRAVAGRRSNAQRSAESSSQSAGNE